MIKFGITEAGDAGLDFSWKNKLLEGNIIITKHMTVKNKILNELLLKNKDRIAFGTNVIFLFMEKSDGKDILNIDINQQTVMINRGRWYLDKHNNLKRI